MGIGAASFCETGTGDSALESAFTQLPYIKNLMQADLKIGRKDLFLKGEFMLGKYNFDSATNLKAGGFGFTAGKFLMPNKLSAVARYEEFNPDRSVVNGKEVKWTTAGLNYFPSGNVKLQANYVFKREAENSSKNDLFITQLQHCF